MKVADTGQSFKRIDRGGLATQCLVRPSILIQICYLELDISIRVYED